ncbi:MAG TPA: hypothetical protein DCR93_35250, partial [Cytophagales bacterium]|nr:hypothetical protein [Cytophagales bacterium]
MSLFALPVPEYDDVSFYQTNTAYNTGEFTFPVNVGLEYKGTFEANWRKPELSSTDEYQNAVPPFTSPHNETVAINIPDDNEALYVHREREDGPHQYSSYGVNWFSRSTRSSVIKSLTTTFPSLNQLLPPGNVAPLLIREESPLLLTSAAEQTRLQNISGGDKTLIRLTFDYHTGHELLSYKITPEDMGSFTDPLHPDAIYPDSEEIFADEVDIYFRDELPNQVVGKVKSVANDLSNPVLSIVRTENYPLYSTGEELVPTLTPSQMPNFVGGVLIVEETEFVIHEVSPSSVLGEGPIFKVYKRELTDAVFAGTNSIPQAGADLQAPEVQADGKMLAIENMVSPSSWGGPNPHPLQVQIGDNWSIHREVIEREGPDDDPEQILEKFRGLYDDAAIIAVTGETGVYQITFNSTQLAHHPQYSANGTSVDWYGGIVRVHTDADPNGPRKTLQVLQIQQIGTGQNVQLLVLDPQYGQGNDANVVPISLGTGISVHFYPGYKVYLYANAAAGITEGNTLPATGEGTRYTIFGMRTKDLGGTGFVSKIGVPKMMFAQEILEPRVPEAPLGIPYTTRPDSFGKSTFTFTNQFTHRPHGLMYYRADDLLLLNALYTPATVATIVAELAKAENAPFAVNRWQNVLGFDYTYTDPDTINTNGHFAYYPDTVDGYRLPNPDNPNLFTGGGTPGSVIPGNMVSEIKAAVYQVFTTLTEMPLLYDHIRTDAAYIPKSGRQVVRDRNGALLSTNDPAFDIAPMAKVVGTNKVQFTDFGIDGTSGNLFFYTAREVGNTLQMGEFSDIFGPVKPVNAKAPVAPFIQR